MRGEHAQAGAVHRHAEGKVCTGMINAVTRDAGRGFVLGSRAAHAIQTQLAIQAEDAGDRHNSPPKPVRCGRWSCLRGCHRHRAPAPEHGKRPQWCRKQASGTSYEAARNTSHTAVRRQCHSTPTGSQDQSADRRKPPSNLASAIMEPGRTLGSRETYRTCKGVAGMLAAKCAEGL